MQKSKSGVKTLSIIDTLSELAHDETEASRLALPSPISVQRGTGNRLSSNFYFFHFNRLLLTLISSILSDYNLLGIHFNLS